VAILAKNCAEWFIVDLAIIMAGLVSVPIYTTAAAGTIRYVMEHSEAKAVFLGKLARHRRSRGGHSPRARCASRCPNPRAGAEQQQYVTERRSNGLRSPEDVTDPKNCPIPAVLNLFL
jgi:long-subunit acyl-CoA synthetase (AMP-forming)